MGTGHTWGEPRVFFREPGMEAVRSLPARWTDIEGLDPFVTLAAGRSCFRAEDLLALAALVRELGREGCQ